MPPATLTLPVSLHKATAEDQLPQKQTDGGTQPDAGQKRTAPALREARRQHHPEGTEGTRVPDGGRLISCTKIWWKTRGGFHCSSMLKTIILMAQKVWKCVFWPSKTCQNHGKPAVFYIKLAGSYGCSSPRCLGIFLGVENWGKTGTIPSFHHSNGFSPSRWWRFALHKPPQWGDTT